MSRLLNHSLSLFLIGALAAGVHAEADTLASLRWQHRVILVLDPPDTAAVATTFEDWRDALDDRDIVWLILSKNIVTSNAPYESDADLSADLRKTYGKGPAVVLIGKDGGTKQRTTDLDLASLLALIDTMPMRRREMRDSQ